MDIKREAFNPLLDAHRHMINSYQVGAQLSADGRHLQSIQFSDRFLYVSFQLAHQDQQTLVLYRDERTELVIEQRPVRPRRRVNDVEPTVEREGPK